jgi:hypothetical protein
VTFDGDDEWVNVGEAARVAGRDRSTVRRWADQQLVTARRSATGHRQILLSSLRAVLDSGGKPFTGRVDPNAGRVMFERWLRESAVLARWVPDSRVPVETLYEWRSRLFEIEDAVSAVRTEIDECLTRADDDPLPWTR